MNPLIRFLSWRGWRSAAAVIAGFVVTSGLVLLADTLLTLALAPPGGPTGALPAPTPPYLVLNLLAGVVCGTIGGYVAAWIARRGEQLLHGAGLGALMIALSIASIVNPPPGAPPRWYQLALAVIGPVSALFGAWLRSRRAMRAALPAT